MANSVTFLTSVGGDGSTVSDDDNPTTGLANGGAIVRLIPSYSNVVNIASYVITIASNAVNAPATSATSTTSLTIGTGSKSLTLAETGKLFYIGQTVSVSDTTGLNVMSGTVTAFNSGTGAMTVNVANAIGTGTIASWIISVGALNFGTLTASKALVSDASGKVAVSTVTATELSLLSGKTALLAVNTNNNFTSEQTIKGVRISNGAGNQNNNIVIGEGGGGLSANTTGNYNYCIGYSMVNCTTGSNNYAFGRGALDALVSYSNCVGIGWDAAVGGSNQMRLGNTSVTVYTQSGTVSASDERDKTDIRDTVLGLDFINSLRPVDYKWDIRLDYAPKMPEPIAIPDNATDVEKAAIEIENKAARDLWLEAVKPANLKHDGTHKRNRYHHGLIAQEVGALGVDFGGWQNFEVNGGEALQAVVYEELIAPLIKAVQELSARVVELENR